MAIRAPDGANKNSNNNNNDNNNDNNDDNNDILQSGYFIWFPPTPVSTLKEPSYLFMA